MVDLTNFFGVALPLRLWPEAGLPWSWLREKSALAELGWVVREANSALAQPNDTDTENSVNVESAPRQAVPEDSVG
jgi:hypothetical protein